jgi:VWFA-related protein
MKPALASLVLTAALLLAARSAAGPQLPAAAPGLPPSSEFTEEVSVGYILVPVVVRTPGGFAERLKKEDFRLMVDGRQVPIDSFEQRADAPASVVFLQDLSGSMESGGKLEFSRQTLRYFLDRSEQGDEFALATFASAQEQIEVPFTRDRQVLYEASDLWKPYGTTALHDAVAFLPEISLDAKNPKRVAVLVTDGEDNASQIPATEARTMVQAAQLPVYVIGLGSGNPFELDAQGKKLYRYADVLQLLANLTGGRYYSVRNNQNGELDRALAAIHEDLRHQYVLGFAAGEGRSAYRKIEVKVSGSGNRSVFFRRGYKGPPPAGAS